LKQSYRVEPKSRENIRSIAHRIRRFYGWEDKTYIPVVELLERLCEFSPSFYYEVIDDSDWLWKEHAWTDVTNGHVLIKQSVYDGAFDEKKRDRMTIAHEIGHYVMHHLGNVRMETVYTFQKLESYEDPEWQAKCFAGELLMPYHWLHLLQPDEIERMCGVSFDAVQTHLKAVRYWFIPGIRQ
jgi:hypothetical protein